MSVVNNMLQVVCVNEVETWCDPAVCKSAHQRTGICVTFSSFTASVHTSMMIKRSLTAMTLNKMILVILCAPGQQDNLEVSDAVILLNQNIWLMCFKWTGGLLAILGHGGHFILASEELFI